MKTSQRFACIWQRWDFKTICFDLIDFLKHVLNLVLLEREINFGRLNIFLTQKHGFIFLPFEFGLFIIQQ